MELMITVAIVGILSSIAYPSYTKYVARANRTAVQSYMFNLSNKQEQYLLDARSYAANLAALNVTAPKEISGKYTVTVTSDMTTTPPSYMITATALGTQATKDASCTPLTLSNTGAKTPAVSCW